MSDEQAPKDPRQLARQYLDSLRAAGVEWLPRAAVNVESPSIASRSPANTEVSAMPRSKELPVTAVVVDDAPAAEPASTQSLKQRGLELTVLAEKVSGCTRCPELASTRTQTVFGVGQPGVELCFVGEAPGADEDAQGEPFVGAAGQLLNKIIIACGMKREEVYICNTIKCRPPGNRTPLPAEIANCNEYFKAQLDLVRPKYIVALGASAAQTLLETTTALGKLRGRFHDYRGIPVLVTYHPAYLLPHRAPEKKKDVWEDMQMLLTRMGRPIPKKTS